MGARPIYIFQYVHVSKILSGKSSQAAQLVLR